MYYRTELWKRERTSYAKKELRILSKDLHTQSFMRRTSYVDSQTRRTSYAKIELRTQAKQLHTQK